VHPAGCAVRSSTLTGLAERIVEEIGAGRLPSLSCLGDGSTARWRRDQLLNAGVIRVIGETAGGLVSAFEPGPQAEATFTPKVLAAWLALVRKPRAWALPQQGHRVKLYGVVEIEGEVTRREKGRATVATEGGFWTLMAGMSYALRDSDGLSSAWRPL
jgi:hypothetical protein